MSDPTEQVLLRWRPEDLPTVIRDELRERTWPILTFYVALAGGVAWLLGLGYAAYQAEARLLVDAAVPFGAGVIAMILTVVPHELIHGLAYRITGARTVRYGAHLRQLMFHASAPGHRLSVRALGFVALAPFLVLTPAIVALATIGGIHWSFAACGLLLAHTQGCVGDFAMLSHLLRLRQRYGDLVSYDEPAPDGGLGDFVVARVAARR